jgi:DNA-binding GntR family transcriptional regulator
MAVAKKKAAAKPVRAPKRQPRRSVLSDEIYDMIKAMIFDHDIAPGSRVNIDALAVQLEVSQTPIREALARLESDGLIAKEPLRGYSATDLLTMNQFNDLFQFRLLIEPWAAEEAARKVDDTGITALKAEMQSAKTALKFKDDYQFQALTEHDARFHTLIAHISGSKSVADAFERTHCHLHLFRLFMASKLHLIDNETRAKFVEDLFDQYYQSGSGQLAIKEHETIAKAIIEHNTKAARTAMHSHIESSLKRFSPAAKALNS